MIVGLIVLASTIALMVTLTLYTIIWIVVGMMLLLGCSYGFTQQLPVTAMLQITKDERKELANGSALLTVLQATAAPMGVAVLSSFVSARSQQYTHSLSIEGITGELLHLQSFLLAMHEAFLASSLLIIVALLAMFFVPRKGKRRSSASK